MYFLGYMKSMKLYVFSQNTLQFIFIRQIMTDTAEDAYMRWGDFVPSFPVFIHSEIVHINFTSLYQC